MKNSYALILFIGLFSLVMTYGILGAESTAQQTAWPQWRGPNRDGISAETGLLKIWPENGPNVLWRIPLGEGYSGIAVAQEYAYTMFAAGDDEFVVCLDATSGIEHWRFRTDSRFTESHGNGPRSTPTVDNDRLYVVSAKGNLYALNTKDGKKIWECNLQEEFGSSLPSWGFAGSVLIEEDLLLLAIGDQEGKSLAAFNKYNGTLQWTAYTDALSYSSPIAVTFNKQRQIIFLTANNIVSVAPESGQIYWTHQWSDTINITTPMFIPPDKIFISSAYDKGATLLKMRVTDKTIEIDEIWMNRVMKNWFNSSVLHDNFLYGFDNAIFKCIAADSGQEQWKTRGFERGSVILADGHLIALGENGKLVLVEASAEAYREKSSVQILEGKCWTPPTLSGGKLYLRNEKEMLCLDMVGIEP